MTGITPLQSPTIADEDSALSVDRSVTDRYDGVSALGFRHFADGRMDNRLGGRTVERPRKRQQDDHGPPLIQLVNNLI